MGEKPKVDALARAVAVFGNPWCWAAIAALIVNDHLLKAAAPSWLTGKLSDVAGLFFFPFLLAVPLSALAGRRAGAYAVGVLAFAVTAGWFAAIKTLPAINGLTAKAVGALLGGGPVRIALDPTDLVALVVLWPAWRLWRSVPGRAAPAGRVRRLAGTAALGVAVLATMATSPPTNAVVTHLAVDGPIVYARVTYRAGSSASVDRSADGGDTWFQAGQPPDDPLPAHVETSLAANRAQPVIQCVPSDDATCYRTAPEGRVEVSHDGGRNWSTAWSLPRQDYRRRSNNPLFSPIGPDQPFDPGPYDLVVVPSGPGHRVIVALGSEGVVVRTQDGAWAQQQVGSAAPSSPRAASLTEALEAVAGELFLALVLAPAVALALAAAATRSGLSRQRGLGAIRSAAVMAMGAAAVAQTWWFYTGEWWWFALVAALTLSGAGLVAMVLRTQRQAPGEVATVKPPVLAAAAAVFLAAWLPFPLWALGLLPSYASAVAVAACGAVMTLAWGWRRSGRL